MNVDSVMIGNVKVEIRAASLPRRRRTLSACVRLIVCGRVAQLVEQRPFKAWVAGSNPAALTIVNCRFATNRLRFSVPHGVLPGSWGGLGALVGLALGFVVKKSIRSNPPGSIVSFKIVSFKVNPRFGKRLGARPLRQPM